ncbi:sugar ABC transporter ATP-binding protein [Modestobacter roseus]|uniref:Ribose transport system ATP-binding protein n=1 Tax=Modestobacter roseus TaxID=1181884 RepID=A0A562IP76_9ACTN|nr:sugar ABC transporter ATP-binding protein [Modestobacter roseus]MQA35400.1 ATP-binding cassette domain-containing protein [Modestobacter roseus]TWH72702.1 ribose transport system ATP-binding protein [Modestobacter roseus]
MTTTHTPPAPTTDVALRITGMTKRFGATLALDGADLALRHGTVHALVGGNGCGKSTTIKVLAGVHRADAGRIEVAGSVWSAADYDARAGRAAGLRFVHQDLGLFPELSIAENVALDAGYPRGLAGRVSWAALHRRVAGLLETYEIDASPATPVRALRPAQRTLVAIARALQDQESDQHLVLVLDEPTATLPQHESQLLLDAVRRRADRGQTVLIVSHRMPEVLAVSDDFTVFRDGRTVASLVAARPTEGDLVARMTGAGPGTGVPAADGGGGGGRPAPAEEQDDVVLEVSGLSGGPLRGLDLQVRRGEIVGVTGLVGSGRTSLLKTVFGEHTPVEGSVRIASAGSAGTTAATTTARIGAGVAYVPEDRGGEAAFADLTLRHNLSATVLRRYWRPWGMALRRERAEARALIRGHGIKASSSEVPFSALSGGNQQKAILARWLRREPTLLLLDEPTQGVDVMSRSDIYRTVQETAARGCAVLVASSDLLELCGLCDRVLVLRDGRVAAEVSGPDLTADRLTALTQSTDPATGPAPTRGDRR